MLAATEPARPTSKDVAALAGEWYRRRVGANGSDQDLHWDVLMELVERHSLNAAAYEQLMGRWSRRLARLLIPFGRLADGDRVLDVGCGTGSLIFALPGIANISKAVGIDEAELYLDHARSLNHDPRIRFERADAVALPFGDASFDRAYCLLVLQFIPDAPRAVEEMRRVVRPRRYCRGGSMGLVQRAATVAYDVGYGCYP